MNVMVAEKIAPGNECAVQSMKERLGCDKNALKMKKSKTRFCNRRKKKVTVSPVRSIAPEYSMMIVQVLHFDRCRVCAGPLRSWMPR